MNVSIFVKEEVDLLIKKIVLLRMKREKEEREREEEERERERVWWNERNQIYIYNIEI